MGKTRVVPEAVIGKMQASPTPEGVKEKTGFVGIWGFRKLLSSPRQCLHPLGHLVGKGHIWDWDQSSSHVWAGKNTSEAMAS